MYQLGSRPTFFLPRWTAHPCILHQLSDGRGTGAFAQNIKGGIVSGRKYPAANIAIEASPLHVRASTFGSLYVRQS